MPVTNQGVDIKAFHQANPESVALQLLADPDRSKDGEWWDTASLEYDRGILSPTEIMAAYLATMHPIEDRAYEQVVLDTVPKLQAGVVIAARVISRSSNALDLDASRSGTLKEDAFALLGHPSHRTRGENQSYYASVGIGVALEERDDEIDLNTTWLGELLVGQEAIVEAYTESITKPVRLFDKDNYPKVSDFSRRITNAAIIRRLGLAHIDDSIGVDRASMLDQVPELRDRAIQQGSVQFLRRDYIKLLIDLLPAIHTLSIETGEDTIDALVTKSPIVTREYGTQLTETLSRIRSPKYLEGVSHLTKLALTHEAWAEIYRLQDADLKARANTVLTTS
jgi:hypothetical protein